MSNSFVKGAFIITIATIISKVIGSVYRIPLQNIAGDEVLGIFSIVYPVYMALLILTVAGIPLAISKLISEARVDGRHGDIYYIFHTASLLAIVFGFTSFGLIVLFVDKIAFLLGGSFAVYSLIVVSIALIVAPYMAVYRGFFQGFENMKPTAISQVLEQFIRVIVILVAAYFLTVQNYSNEIVAAGVMVGSFIGVMASLLYLRSLFRTVHNNDIVKQKYSVILFKTWAKKILQIAIPICIGALTMALLNMVDSITIPLQLAGNGLEREVTYLYGIYGRGLALVQIAVVFASALVLPLVPHITVALKNGEGHRLKEIIEKTSRFANLTSWPIALGLVALTMPLNLALFKDLQGNVVLAILSLSALFTAFSVLTTGVLQGMNKANQAAVAVLFCAGLKVILNVFLVSEYGLTGAAISTFVTYIVLTLLNVMLIYKVIPFQILNRSNIVFALGSIFMALVISSPLAFISVEGWTRYQAFLYLCCMIIMGALIYSGFIILFKGFTKAELFRMIRSRN